MAFTRGGLQRIEGGEVLEIGRADIAAADDADLSFFHDPTRF